MINSFFNKRIIYCIIFFITILYNVNITSVFCDDKSVSQSKKSSLEKSDFLKKKIMEIDEERAKYYNAKNEWENEKKSFNTEISVLEKELDEVRKNVETEKKKNLILQDNISKLKKNTVSGKDGFNEYSDILGILNDVLNKLESEIKSGLPFDINERLELLRFSREYLSKTGVSLTDKFIKVFELMKKELSYLSSVEITDSKIGSGESAKIVKLLRISKAALYYKTLDGGDYGMLIKKNGSYIWKTNLSIKDKSTISRAFAIAGKLKPAELLLLPVPEF